MIARRTVLIVTDEPERLALLTEALKAAGYDTKVVARTEEATQCDLSVVDTSRGRHWTTADLLSTGRLVLIVDGADDMRRGFELGAEDCVLTTAHPDEIVARCDAVLRRTADQPAPDPGEPVVYVDRLLWVNFGSRQVWVGGRPAHLTPREFRLLRHLIRNRDTTLSHEDILGAVWERDADSDRPTEVLKQYIWRLRQKIESDPNEPDTIVTDPGKGYRFVSRLA
ncbi:MAG: response regulator transcription factor [Anaerolineae bacterium]